ncbi:hypothetical protein [Bradyrhizobium sp. STM 3557]|uniref:hypothetical protein n=1 Tax=Bradyrhizobium sp. STM 3557 TaxID=578920 RepID=UPI00388DEFB7
MPFVFATFQNHLNTADPHRSRFKKSSFADLEEILAGGMPWNMPQIQAEYGAIPHNKQVKYANACNYLKANIPGLADAIPVQPKMHYRRFRVLKMNHAGNPNYILRFYHVHELTWVSSNGHAASLSNVGTRERVTWRTSPAGPPFDATMNAGIPMTFTQGATTNAGAQACSNYDDHSIGNPDLVVRRPLAAGSVIADQVYEYTADGTNWYPIPEAYFELERGVRQRSGRWVMYFCKRNGAGNPRRFHFEVEYPLGPLPPPPPGGTLPVIPEGFASAGNIRDYASRVISLG